MVNVYVEQLRRICGSSEPRAPGYVLKTRVERALYGMVVAICETRIGRHPAGLDQIHLHAVLPEPASGLADRRDKLAWEIVRTFEEFTYISDTSNQSDDGQSLHMASFIRRFATICDEFESVAN